MLRRTDTNQDYDYADVGERTDYFITDPQFSVCAVVDSTGKLQERLAYSAYGEAQHHFPADMDGDGDVDSIDTNWFTNLNNLKDIDESGYNPDGDLNRDGSVNTADLIIAFNWNGSAALTNGLISDPNGPDNPIGYDGYLFNAETKLYTVRFRHYEPVTGRWVERDPLGYVDGPNTSQFVHSRPTVFNDYTGAEATQPENNALTPPGDARNDPSQGCGIKVKQQDFDATDLSDIRYGHQWIEIDDPGRGSPGDSDYRPPEQRAVGRYPFDGGWTSPYPSCTSCSPNDDPADGNEADTEWDVEKDPDQIIRIPVERSPGGDYMGGGTAYVLNLVTIYCTAVQAWLVRRSGTLPASRFANACIAFRLNRFMPLDQACCLGMYRI